MPEVQIAVLEHSPQVWQKDKTGLNACAAMQRVSDPATNGIAALLTEVVLI